MNDVSGQPPAARGDRMTWLPAADAGLRVVGLSHLAVHISPDNPHYQDMERRIGEFLDGVDGRRLA